MLAPMENACCQRLREGSSLLHNAGQGAQHTTELLWHQASNESTNAVLSALDFDQQDRQCHCHSKATNPPHNTESLCCTWSDMEWCHPPQHSMSQPLSYSCTLYTYPNNTEGTQWLSCPQTTQAKKSKKPADFSCIQNLPLLKKASVLMFSWL